MTMILRKENDFVVEDKLRVEYECVVCGKIYIGVFIDAPIVAYYSMYPQVAHDYLCRIPE